jgi:tryptophan 2,3-dioxygenase
MTVHSPVAALFSAESVAAQCHRVGKHFLPTALLRHLDAQRRHLRARPALGGDERMQSRWLDIALDKFDGRYDYNTYLALTLFGLPDPAAGTVDPWPAATDRDLLVCWLLTDVLDFELRLDTSRDDRRLPLLRPDADLRLKRARLALRAAAAPTERLFDMRLDPKADPSIATAALAQAIAGRVTQRQRRWWPLTMMPVYRVHDEWMFIRVLQAFEVTFAQLAAWLAHAVELVDTGRPDQADAAIRAATALLGETRPLFALMATLQPDAFHRFRVYTDGASAIQSASFKLVEVLAGGRPSAARLASAAYDGMAHIRHLAAHDARRTLPQAIAGMSRAGEAEQLRGSLAHFVAAVHRWRTTHVSLARRMLGPAVPGTGATEGVAYLDATRHLPTLDRSHGKEIVV